MLGRNKTLWHFPDKSQRLTKLSCRKENYPNINSLTHIQYISYEFQKQNCEIKMTNTISGGMLISCNPWRDTRDLMYRRKYIPGCSQLAGKPINSDNGVRKGGDKGLSTRPLSRLNWNYISALITAFSLTSFPASESSYSIL